MRFAPLSWPLPQLESHGSNESCWGKRDAGKLHVNGCDEGESFATHPIIGTVTIGLVPRSRFVLIIASTLLSASAGVFSKYQSLPLLVVRFLKL